MFDSFFSKKVSCMRYVEKCGGARGAADGNMAHARCVLDYCGYCRESTRTHRNV